MAEGLLGACPVGHIVKAQCTDRQVNIDRINSVAENAIRDATHILPLSIFPSCSTLPKKKIKSSMAPLDRSCQNPPHPQRPVAALLEEDLG
jgi:hypothetical protein